MTWSLLGFLSAQNTQLRGQFVCSTNYGPTEKARRPEA
jgi:hypothetical protein